MSSNMTRTLTPAQELEGRTLPNGWKVMRRIPRPQTATGGYFSTSYIVCSTSGEKAFLKAMDYQRALISSDPARELQAMTAAYVFERTLLQKCRERRLSRIVNVLDSGTLPSPGSDPSGVVEYLVFEIANGDIRQYIDAGEEIETAWALRTIHGAAAALQQLHSIRIAHQDVKPSNLLVFEDEHPKLADLGRAFDRDAASPFDELNIAGDKTYAPPELLYGQVAADWQERRLGCDMYLLGSLVMFFFTGGVSMTHLLLTRLSKDHHYNNWTATYGEVLPYLQHAFVSIIYDLRQSVDTRYSRVPDIVSQLCNPDPKRRGHPKTLLSSANQYSLERYVSIFGNMASRAEYSLTEKLRAAEI